MGPILPFALPEGQNPSESWPQADIFSKSQQPSYDFMDFWQTWGDGKTISSRLDPFSPGAGETTGHDVMEHVGRI